MDEQMNKLFAEGGVNTGDTQVDPISGNEVPPGSMPNEVRDDIDAKLSGGEYVVPADVLRYYGVAFFEKLRAKAKAGLGEMDADGRIGGASPEEEEEDFPFSAEELDSEDMGFAEGGMTTPAPTSSFNPADWSLGSSFGGGGMGQTQVKKYKDRDGNPVNVLFIDGKPVIDVKALGYTEFVEETPVATGEEVKAPEAPVQSGGSSDRDQESSKEQEPIDPAKNYYNLPESDLLNPEYKAFGSDKLVKGLAVVSPLLGAGSGLIRGFQEANNLADARARSIIAKERNLDTTALDAAIKKMEEDSSGLVQVADFFGLDGKNIAARMKKDSGIATPTVPTAAPTSSGIVKKPSSGGTSSVSSGGSSSSGGGSSYAPTSSPRPVSKPTATVSTPSGTKTVSSTPTTASRSYTSPTTKQLQDKAAGNVGMATPTKTTINSSAYTGQGYTRGRAKGGLVQKPKKS